MDDGDQRAAGAASWLADVATYRRRRRAARLVSAALAAPLLWLAAAMVTILHRGGDTRMGMVVYLVFLVHAAVSAAVLVPVWRRVRAARAALPAVEDEAPEPGPHLGLSGTVVPPRRW